GSGEPSYGTIFLAEGILSPVRQTGVRKGPAAFGTLVATTAMPAGYWLDARERQLQGQLSPPVHHLCFLEPRIGPEDLDSTTDGQLDRFLAGGKERRAGIRKRIGPEQAQSQLLDAVQVAPEHRLGEEKEVSPR